MRRVLAAAAAVVCAVAVTASGGAQAAPARRARWACAQGAIARRYTPGDDSGGEVPATFCFTPGFRVTSPAAGDSYRCATTPRNALGHRAPDAGITIWCTYVPGL